MYLDGTLQRARVVQASVDVHGSLPKPEESA
jgi:hypothetical protein